MLLTADGGIKRCDFRKLNLKIQCLLEESPGYKPRAIRDVAGVKMFARDPVEII